MEAMRQSLGDVFTEDGISHNKIEDAKPEHLKAGRNVLLLAMLGRAGRQV